jgi:hypothetical protein
MSVTVDPPKVSSRSTVVGSLRREDGHPQRFGRDRSTQYPPAAQIHALSLLQFLRHARHETERYGVYQAF